ncbi:MAG: hypothetical protein JWL76_1551 [Thermoleophilia bacterium]|nr:hypothetical protein [Thermoleophilia bacterium]
MSVGRVAGPAAFATTVVSLVVLLVHATLNPDLPQFDGKAMAARLVLFPLAATIVPAGWWVVRRRRAGSLIAFPWAAATLLVLPFVIDLLGNALTLYIDIEHFDDAVHTINPILGVAGVALLLDRTSAQRWAVWTMAFGLGCAAHICFEIIEYLLLEGIGAVQLDLSLSDTLSDLAYGMVGAALGAGAPLLGGPRERDIDRNGQLGRRRAATASGHP